MPALSMASTLPATPPGSHREVGSQALPAQTELHWQTQDQRLATDEATMVTAFRAAVNAYGGADALRAALGERETYLSKISEGMTGGKPVQARWLLPLLDDPRSAAVLIPFLNARAGYEPPVLQREVTQEEIDRAVREEVAHMGELATVLRERVAKKLGVRPGTVRL